VSDPRHRKFVNRLLPRSDGAVALGGRLLQSDSDTFDGFHTTSAVVPTYTTFPLSVAITTTRPQSFVHIYAYIAWNFTGPPAGTIRAANFRFRLNGALIASSRATSCETAAAQITTVSYSRLLVVTPGLQTVTFEWAKQSGTGTLTVRTDVGVTPDVFGANLKIQEYAAA
jgi:hypothetical protein